MYVCVCVCVYELMSFVLVVVGIDLQLHLCDIYLTNGNENPNCRYILANKTDSKLCVNSENCSKISNKKNCRTEKKRKG